MTDVVTSQPVAAAAQYADPVVIAEGNTPVVVPWITPGVAARLDFLALLSEVWVKHALFHRDPLSTFLPSEYHVTTPDGKMIYCGKEVAAELQETSEDFCVTFLDSVGTEVMTVRKGCGSFSLCQCGGVQHQPACHMTEEKRDIGTIKQRKSGCSDIDFVYENEHGVESPYSIPIAGAKDVGEDNFYPIKENDVQAGVIVGETIEHIHGQENIVHYKINFPSTADARQKAAMIAAVIRLDTDLFSPMSRRYRGLPNINVDPHVGVGNSVAPL